MASKDTRYQCIKERAFLCLWSANNCRCESRKLPYQRMERSRCGRPRKVGSGALQWEGNSHPQHDLGRKEPWLNSLPHSVLSRSHHTLCRDNPLRCLTELTSTMQGLALFLGRDLPMSLNRVRMAPSRRPQQFSNWFKYYREQEKQGQCGWSHAPEKPIRVSCPSDSQVLVYTRVQGSWSEAAGIYQGSGELVRGSWGSWRTCSRVKVRQQSVDIHVFTSLALAGSS